MFKNKNDVPSFDIESIAKNWCNKDFRSSLPKPLNKKNTIFFLYGRNALYAILLILKEKKKLNTILFPAYSCGDEIEPAKTLGYEIHFFRLVPDGGLQVDLRNLLKKLKNFKGILIITHYLGFAQKDIDIIAEFCKKKGIILIEECAHCLGNKYKGKALGTFGDYAIFSMRKNMPLPHGGALVTNKSDIKNIRSLVKRKVTFPPSEAVNLDLFIFLGYKLSLLDYGTKITQILKNFSVKQTLHGPRLANYGGYSLQLSYFAKALLPYINWKPLMIAKRKNYIKYLNYFKKNNLNNFIVVNKVMTEEYPIFFPVYVDNSEEFSYNLKKQEKIGLQPFWSHKHKLINWKLFIYESNLKKKIIVLPTSYFIGYKKLKLISRSLLSQKNEKST